MRKRCRSLADSNEARALDELADRALHGLRLGFLLRGRRRSFRAGDGDNHLLQLNHLLGGDGVSSCGVSDRGAVNRSDVLGCAAEERREGDDRGSSEEDDLLEHE